MNRIDEIYVAGYEDHAQLEPADTLAGELGDDPLDAGYSVPDHLTASNRWETEVEQARRAASLDEHLAAEEPEITDEDLDHVDEDGRAGRLVALEDTGTRGDMTVARDVGKAGWAGSAEEAAMHVVTDLDEPDEFDGALAFDD